MSHDFITTCAAHNKKSSDSRDDLERESKATFPRYLHAHRVSIAPHSSEYLSFVLLFCIYSFISSLFFSLFFFSRPALFCCVLVPGTLVLHLLYLGELRLFGLLCFTTVVCDHRMCFSLGRRISTNSGCTDDIVGQKERLTAVKTTL